MAQVYAIQGMQTQLVKIGITNCFSGRLKAYRNHSAEQLKVLAVFECGGGMSAREFEYKVLREWFPDRVVHGEWFRPTEGILLRISQWAALYGNGTKVEWTQSELRVRELAPGGGMVSHTCKRCGHVWTTPLVNPVVCGGCGSILWNVDRQRARGSGRPKGSSYGSDRVRPALTDADGVRYFNKKGEET